ncbi:hypothetical protein AVEN_214084-1 [Araneus ventricosus]|uniref:Uncharacterized protein n=1 Tax=Araneus ventricosus TaxID=182803 RepID=A0A4Y2NUD2_ARAVE|nr:hypothetical protein AVEN_214084-1 [Araneus ventricosus]
MLALKAASSIEDKKKKLRFDSRIGDYAGGRSLLPTLALKITLMHAPFLVMTVGRPSALSGRVTLYYQTKSAQEFRVGLFRAIEDLGRSCSRKRLTQLQGDFIF